MKKLTSGILALLMMVFIISFVQKDTKDALSLYSEINKKDAPNTLSNTEKKDGWKLLFDGKTTNGWHGYNLKVFPDCWAVNNGT